MKHGGCWALGFKMGRGYPKQSEWTFPHGLKLVAMFDCEIFQGLYLRLFGKYTFQVKYVYVTLYSFPF